MPSASEPTAPGPEPGPPSWSERLASAQHLLAAGLLWSPQPGDRFIIPVGEMAGEIYFVADMTITVHPTPSGRVLGFNGTTEWALDSLALTDVVWLPREDQLREALGDRFVALRAPGAAAPNPVDHEAWQVDVLLGEAVVTCEGADAEQAYARAVLAMLEAE